MAKRECVCATCKFVGEPRRDTPGSIAIELLLWLCFFIPGIIYSLWRHSNRADVCTLCGSKAVHDVNTPQGLHLMRERQQGKA